MTFITEQFAALAASVATGKGLPDLPLVVLPHGIEHFSEERIRALTDEAFGKVIAAVTVHEGEADRVKGVG